MEALYLILSFIRRERHLGLFVPVHLVGLAGRMLLWQVSWSDGNTPLDFKIAFVGISVGLDS